MQRRNLVVAIDGPSGSGKSTVARGSATALGLRYLDTGAMYRAVTWLALERGIALTDDPGLAELARDADIRITTDPAAPAVAIEGIDVTSAVRSREVTAAVSAVSAVPGVRAAMVERQQAVIGAGGIVVEGRDIGTTVAPDAAVKVYLTADAATRAQRRTVQDGLEATAVAGTEAAMNRRDAADSSRTASPLTQAPDAVLVDSSAMSADEVIAMIVGEVAGVAP